MIALTTPDRPPPSLGEVCTTLVSDGLARKSHAFQLTCRVPEIGDSPHVTEFIQSRRGLTGNAATLLGLLPSLRQEGELAALSWQAAAYVYYSTTLLEVFQRDRVDAGHRDIFDILARAKQARRPSAVGLAAGGRVPGQMGGCPRCPLTSFAAPLPCKDSFHRLTTGRNDAQAHSNPQTIGVQLAGFAATKSTAGLDRRDRLDEV